MIELHSSPTSNGQKVMIMLEETGLEWKHVDVNLGLGEQFSPEHLKLSPNNRIPAIVDTEGPGGGRYTMMESGAILCYLADKTDRLFPKQPRRRYDTLQWLFFQMAHVGPMFGQVNHFTHIAKDNPYARDRYNNESLRLYRVLENRLGASEHLGCGEYTIADIATYPWCKRYDERGIDEARFPNFMRWFRTIKARPAVQRSDEMTVQIRARIAKAAEGKTAVNIYDTRESVDRLTRATSLQRPES